MTIQFPDVSQYTPNVDPSKYPAIIARATLSDRVADPTYQTFKAKAAAAGTVFAAYHWLNHGNLHNQAAWCFRHVGPGIPVMIDAEDVAGNTGYAGPLTVDDLLGFAAEYRAFGGVVSLCYLPFWYWSGAMGAPHRLGELATAGIHLVSSNYPNSGYTESGPGWAVYYPGAPVPVQWQYTSTPIDMNAFRGSVADFAQMIGADMAFLDDPNAAALAWRMDAFKAGSPTIRGGSEAGEPMVAMQNLIDLKAAVGALSVPAPAPVDAAALKAVLLDPAVLAALAKAVNDDAAARLQS